MNVVGARKEKIVDAYIHAVSAINELKGITFPIETIHSDTANRLSETLSHLKSSARILRGVMATHGLPTPSVPKQPVSEQ